jgi:hypothetical protein
VKVKRGVKSAILVGRDKIAGDFDSSLTDLIGFGNSQYAVAFANWADTSEEIIRFTREYGPLDRGPEPNAAFSFSIEDFRNAQSRFREMWKGPEGFSNLPMKGANVVFSGGTITVHAATLNSFLEFDLLMAPPERIRICKRPGCDHPYFIAEHLRRQFCSPECAEEGQRSLKRDWWQKSGASWRTKQREKSQKEKSSGPQQKG